MGCWNSNFPRGPTHLGPLFSFSSTFWSCASRSSLQISLVESGGGGGGGGGGILMMIKNGLSVVLMKSQSGGGGGFVPSSLGRRLVIVSDVVGDGGGVFSSTLTMGSSSSRRFFNTGGGITTSSSSSSLVVIRQDMFRTGNFPNLFRGRQTGGCVGSFVPHQCNICHMLPYFARALASSSASQSLGQTPRQEPERKKKECQIIRSFELQRERCDEISSTKVSLNQFPRLMVHGNVEDSKTRRLLRLNPDIGCFEEEQGVSAASNHHGHYELQVPNKHVCRGSAYGWLFLTYDNLDMKLLNPFSGAEIQLPPVKTLPNLEGHLSKWFVSKAIFSANPSTEPRPLVLVIYGQYSPKLAFCKPGDKGWTPLEFPEEVVSFHRDAIYHKGQFHVLGYPGSICAFDIGRGIEDDDYSVKSVIVANSPKNKMVYFRDWFFVVLDGEFFRFELRKECFRDCCVHESMQFLEDERERDGDTTDEDYNERNSMLFVYEMERDGDTTDEDSRWVIVGSKHYNERNSDGDTWDEESEDRKKERWNRREKSSCMDMDLPLQTYGIKIRRFDASEKQWVKVESLGEKAVFLGYNTSFALSASDYPAGVCIPNSVYFSFGSGGTERTEKRCYDVGIYNVKDKSIKSLYPLRSKSLYPPMDDEDEGSQFKKPAPIWIVNNN